jgi:hypothetical protein
MAFSGSASAVSITPITCTKFSQTVAMSKCSDPAVTGGKGVLGPAKKGSHGIITWAVKGSTTTLKDPTESPSTVGTCPANTQQQEELQAIVVKSAGAAKTAIPGGWVFTAYVCLNQSGKITEAKGAPLTIGPSA